MPVIVIMGRADIDMVIMARDSGANAVLARPISAAQLLDKVTWALSADIPFIRAEGYVGPDRRRFRGVEYEGEERRQDAASRDRDAKE
jgi:DNA-binding response OmpR family regulator